MLDGRIAPHSLYMAVIEPKTFMYLPERIDPSEVALERRFPESYCCCYYFEFVSNDEIVVVQNERAIFSYAGSSRL